MFYKIILYFLILVSLSWGVLFSGPSTTAGGVQFDEPWLEVRNSAGTATLFAIDKDGDLFMDNSSITINLETDPVAAGSNNFIIRSSGGTDLFLVNESNLYIKGTLTENATVPSEDGNDWVFKNTAGTNVAFIDGSTGNLSIAGDASYLHTLTLTNDGNGTTTPASSKQAVDGVATSILAAATGYYRFTSWTETVNADSVTIADATKKSTTATLIGNATIQANFEAVPSADVINDFNDGTNSATETSPDDESMTISGFSGSSHWSTEYWFYTYTTSSYIEMDIQTIEGQDDLVFNMRRLNSKGDLSLIDISFYDGSWSAAVNLDDDGGDPLSSSYGTLSGSNSDITIPLSAFSITDFAEVTKIRIDIDNSSESEFVIGNIEANH